MPTRAGSERMPAEGLATKAAPINAKRTLSHSIRLGFSPRIKMDMRMAKKGESLLSMLASAIPR
jgi:hypothetical protein